MLPLRLSLDKSLSRIHHPPKGKVAYLRGKVKTLFCGLLPGAIIMFGIKEGWDVDEINDALYDEGEETLV